MERTEKTGDNNIMTIDVETVIKKKLRVEGKRVFMSQIRLMVEILDYMTTHREFDYNITDIGSKVGQSKFNYYSIYAAMQKLIDLDMIEETRQSSGKSMFQIKGWFTKLRKITK